MPRPRLTRPRLVAGASLVAVCALALQSGASTPLHIRALTAAELRAELSGGLPGFDPHEPDRDSRGAGVAPAASALAATQRLEAPVSVSWNQFGTVKTMVPVTTEGWLGSGYAGSAVSVARAFLTDHRDLLGLTAADVKALVLVNDAQLVESTGHAVLFRQDFRGVPAGNDGLVAVGVRGDRVASVTSSIAPSTSALNTVSPALTPVQAVAAAVADVGRTVKVADIAVGGTPKSDFLALTVPGFAQGALTRIRALPTPRDGVRLAYETDLIDTEGGDAEAYVSFVDAVTGKVLLRHNSVDQLTADGGAAAATTQAGTQASPGLTPSGGTIQTVYAPSKCGPKNPMTVPAGSSQILLQSNAVNPVNDIRVVVRRNGKVILSDDTAVANEVDNISLDAPATAADKFTFEACPVPGSVSPANDTAPFDVVAVYITNDQATPDAGLPFPAKWQYFESNPALPGKNVNKDLRITACWGGDKGNPSGTKPVSDCDREVSNIYSRLAWDIDPRSGTSTFTTVGNNAKTAQAWISPLTPAEQNSPVSPTRDYLVPWTNQWYSSKCDPTTLLSPQRADVDASIINLFTGHNRIHDFSYRLGYTERNYNMQLSNFGETAPQYQNDQEVGNVQAGALTGGAPAYLGRDNANQITLQDGTPGITNQYLFQPITGFWAPCVDGDMDGLIFGHEYTHGISNRMIAGPDTGLSGTQGAGMGESWSDLNAVEYLNATGVAGATGADPYSAGAYATQNKLRAIRNYNLLQNPLVYGDVGYDATGPEFHADGEIWNGIQMHVRQELINAYNKKGLKYDDRKLQLSCAFGTDYKRKGAPHTGFQGCPGNRRWIQYIYDAWLLQANGSPSFVDMKNAMLAADKVRTGGVDQKVMATAFAQRGLGKSAFSPAADDGETPDFASPVRSANGKATFRVVDAATGKLVPATVWVGRYSARTTPYATTKAGKTATRTFAKGYYELVVRALGYGINRATTTIKAGKTTVVTVKVDANLASSGKGATITGNGIRLAQIIDEDEGTNGGFNGVVADPTDPTGSTTTRTAIKGKAWTINLTGGKHTVKRLNVSVLHRPVHDSTEDPSDFQGRSLPMRAFDVYASSDNGKTYKKVYASASNAFPSGYPRPVAPDLTLRTFTFPKAITADHIKVVVRSNQCTGAKEYRGDQDNDPSNDSDCLSTDNAFKVVVSEIEVFGGTHNNATPPKVRA